MAIFAIELQREVAERPRGRIARAGGQSWIEGPDLAWARRSVGPTLDAEYLLRFLVGENRVPREEICRDLIDRAADWGGHQTAVGGEQVNVKGLERNLRQILNKDGDPAGDRIRTEDPQELGMDAKAIGNQEEPILVARLRLPDIHRAVQRSIQGSRSDPEGANFGAVGTRSRALRVEVHVIVCARRLAVRRIGIDGQAIGQSENPRPDWRRRRRLTEGLGRGHFDVEAGG